jgi:hypothetical protein
MRHPTAGAIDLDQCFLSGAGLPDTNSLKRKSIHAVPWQKHRRATRNQFTRQRALCWLFTPNWFLAEVHMMPSKLLRGLVVAWKAPRWRRAILIALLSDALGFGVVLLPPGSWLLDAATSLALFAILGFRWPLLIALTAEAVPVLQLFPAWTLVVIALASMESEIPRESARTIGSPLTQLKIDSE